MENKRLKPFFPKNRNAQLYKQSATSFYEHSRHLHFTMIRPFSGAELKLS